MYYNIFKDKYFNICSYIFYINFFKLLSLE